MPDSSKQVHFSPLEELDALGKLRLLSKEKSLVQCWKKGQEGRHSFHLDHFFENKFILDLIPLDTIKGPALADEVLVMFEVAGAQYFGSGKMKQSSDQAFHLGLNKHIFKCERRNNYRLQLYPKIKATCYFDLRKMTRFTNTGEVISINKAEAQVPELLKDLVSGETKSAHVMALPIEDISVSGIAIRCGILESSFFKVGIELHGFGIDFNKKFYDVAGAVVAHIREIKDPKRVGIKLFKIGVQFKEVSEAMDRELSAQISEQLRNMDSRKDFEDFIK